MSPLVGEWLDLLLRWAHVVAAIQWIGDSFLFMWMDASLSRPTKPRDGDVVGELWMTHSGGFYEVVKRRTLAPDEMPQSLYWFKWQAYSTWISGFLLLLVVYGLGQRALLVDPGASALHPHAALALVLGLLVVAWLAYDALWMSPLAKVPRVAVPLTLGLVFALAFGLPMLFSARASFLVFGATLGTVMAANVWRRIIPSQSRMVAATSAGTPVDASLGLRAKTRSIHNHYATFPVLFTMLSSHFPSTYGHPLNGLVLALFVVLGMSIKFVMNEGRRSHRGVVLAGVAALAALVGLTAKPRAGATAAAAHAVRVAVPFEQAQAIVDRRCTTCHAARPSNPSFPEPPSGVRLDAPELIVALAARIQARAVDTRTMPLGNLTGMTDAERDTLAAWIGQGAKR